MVKKILKIGVLLILVGLLAAELVARFYMGLGDPPLYRHDDDYEYIYAPNQDKIRFGNRILINSQSMRSEELSEEDEIRILKIGDSVINGGAQTDHDSLATTVLEKRLSAKFGKKIRVLNISAGSWGTDNAMAYIQKHGDFDAKAIVMVYSSHDIRDQMTHTPIVGQHRNYPDTKPVSALWEGFTRYFLPQFDLVRQIKGQRRMPKGRNPGWLFFEQYARTHELPLLVVLHPDRKEVENKAYKVKGQTIANWMDSLGVETLLELNHDPKVELYRDNIHYNGTGQLHLANEVYPWLEKTVQQILFPPPDSLTYDTVRLD